MGGYRPPGDHLPGPPSSAQTNSLRAPQGHANLIGEPGDSDTEEQTMVDLDEDRVFDILMRVRAGSPDETDATREEVKACVAAGLLEWASPEGPSYNMTIAVSVGPGSVPDWASLPKVHPVQLTTLGWERIQSRFGKGFPL